jgi:transposase
MQFDLNDLPSDTALLHRLVRDMASAVEQRDEAKPEPPAKAKNRKKRKSGRKPLPDNLPREEVRVDVSTTVCACGGGGEPPMVATACSSPPEDPHPLDAVTPGR